MRITGKTLEGSLISLNTMLLPFAKTGKLEHLSASTKKVAKCNQLAISLMDGKSKSTTRSFIRLSLVKILSAANKMSVLFITMTKNRESLIHNSCT